jgi:hypothetical protein
MAVENNKSDQSTNDTAENQEYMPASEASSVSTVAKYKEDQQRNAAASEKIMGLFSSMSNSLLQQNVTMSKMLNVQIATLELQKSRYDLQKEAILDEARARRVDTSSDQGESESSNQNPKATAEKKEDGQSGGGLGSFLGTLLGGIAGKILPFIGMSALGAIFGGFIEGVLNDVLGSQRDDGSWKAAIANSAGDAVTWGIIGRFFGKRIAMVAAAAGFLNDSVTSGLNAMGVPEGVVDELSMAISGIVGFAAIKYLPGLLKKALTAALAKTKLGKVGTAIASLFGAGAAAAAPAAASGVKPTAPTPSPRNFTYDAASDTYRSNSTGKPLTGAARASAAAAQAADDELLKNAARRFPGFAKLLRGNAIIGALISLPTIASILMNDQMSRRDKTDALIRELGGLAGGVGGAAVGGLVGSMVPVVGTAIGGVAGGMLGYFGGDWLAGQLANAVMGDPTDQSIPPEIAEQVESATLNQTEIPTDLPDVPAINTNVNVQAPDTRSAPVAPNQAGVEAPGNNVDTLDVQLPDQPDTSFRPNSSQDMSAPYAPIINMQSTPKTSAPDYVSRSVQPRPSVTVSPVDAMRWDETFGATHYEDGSPKQFGGVTVTFPGSTAFDSETRELNPVLNQEESERKRILITELDQMLFDDSGNYTGDNLNAETSARRSEILDELTRINNSGMRRAAEIEPTYNESSMMSPQGTGLNEISPLENRQSSVSVATEIVQVNRGIIISSTPEDGTRTPIRMINDEALDRTNQSQNVVVRGGDNISSPSYIDQRSNTTVVNNMKSPAGSLSSVVAPFTA